MAQRPDFHQAFVYLAKPGNQGVWLKILQAGDTARAANLPRGLEAGSYQRHNSVTRSPHSTVELLSVRPRMLGMGLPVGGEFGGYRLVPDNQQVLGVLVLGLIREVEAPRDDHIAVDDDEFVVGGGVLIVDERRHALLDDELGLLIFHLRSTSIQNHLDLTLRLWTSTNAWAMEGDVNQ